MKALILALILTFGLLCYSVGYNSKPIIAKAGMPALVVIEKPIETVTTNYETIIKEVGVPVPYLVEVPKPVYLTLSDWNSLAELEVFLSKVTIVSFQPNKCAEIALTEIDIAAKEGKRLFFIPLNPQDYYRWYGKESGGLYHVVCGAIIGDKVWYIEPTSGRHWEALRIN